MKMKEKKGEKEGDTVTTLQSPTSLSERGSKRKAAKGHRNPNWQKKRKERKKYKSDNLGVRIMSGDDFSLLSNSVLQQLLLSV
ncbi:putative disintegrin and metalloproteinase [Sesbania bispinosa]|nr:putative disintegrin and metalloproteinase [Sesbania bispinosa]